MANHNIYLKFETSLKWSSKEDGDYTDVGPDSPNTAVNGKDTLTFIAVSGIDKLKKITDGKDSTKKMIKSTKGDDSLSIVATLKDTTVKGEIDSYSISFKPSNGDGVISVDPKMQGQGQP
ncbi:MAG: hypothetical protein RIA69_04455 [Cyclobacteriaceae bacterium]